MCLKWATTNQPNKTEPSGHVRRLCISAAYVSTLVEGARASHLQRQNCQALRYSRRQQPRAIATLQAPPRLQVALQEPNRRLAGRKAAPACYHPLAHLTFCGRLEILRRGCQERVARIQIVRPPQETCDSLESEGRGAECVL